MKSIFLQLAQRPDVFWDCDCSLLSIFFKYKSSTREIHRTVVIQCVTTGILYSTSEILAVLWHLCLKTQSRIRLNKLPTLFLSYATHSL